MAAAEIVRAPIEARLKKVAIDVLGAMGLFVSDTIRMMLVRVVAERSLPFEVRSPNRQIEAAVESAARGNVSRLAYVADLMADLNDDEDVVSN